MYLSNLQILGFKSFAKKTAVLFNSGITGIVGPNGCGKSNIVDAIRWVLGEQKAGVLRSERMDNIIFSGAGKTKPLGMAEVSLTVQNTKNILPIEYSEVVITRRLFRSGESQYLLNGSVCRLKDINDLFMDTGMGPDAYSVIELNMVESILNGKADERRHIFDEAAGSGCRAPDPDCRPRGCPTLASRSSGPGCLAPRSPCFPASTATRRSLSSQRR